MIQKVKDEKWINESGDSVPVKYISAGERLKEKNAAALLKDARAVSEKLLAFKQRMAELCDEVYNKMAEEFKMKENSKGNYTWFNFDRSIKIEVSISERIDFDDIAIKACKEKLDEFLGSNLTTKQEFVKELVADAFSTSRGKLDAKKVMSLLKYRNKINDAIFQDALNLLEGSIRRPDSKRYFRIWERADDGSYELIDLNFSSI